MNTLFMSKLSFILGMFAFNGLLKQREHIENVINMFSYYNYFKSISSMALRIV